jgi:hypothetical protein
VTYAFLRIATANPVTDASSPLDNAAFSLRMKYTQEDLGLVEKHVAQGERNVQQQRQIVQVLRQGGYPIHEALEMLDSLESALHALRQRRSRIRVETRASVRSEGCRAARSRPPASGRS